jgi:prevent-host-death family protein
MKEIPISKFKATCLAVLEQVRKTKKPVLVTRFGKPIAEVVPPSAQPSKSRVLGSMEGSITIHGELVHVTPWLDTERAEHGRK